MKTGEIMNRNGKKYRCTLAAFFVVGLATSWAYSNTASSIFTEVDTRNPIFHVYTPNPNTASSVIMSVSTENPLHVSFSAVGFTASSVIISVSTENPPHVPFSSVGFTATSSPSSVDARNYTLTIYSEQGNPIPSAGVYPNYCWHSAVTCAVDSVVQIGTTNYTSIGWSGDGISPNESTNNTGIIVLTSPESTLTWNWFAETLYQLIVEYGQGGGLYKQNTTVPIAADPAAAGYEFSEWTSAPTGQISQLNDQTAVTTFNIPDENVTLTVNYFQWDSDLDGLPDAWEQALIDADPNDNLETLADVTPDGDWNGNRVPAIFEYAFGENMTSNTPLMFIRMVDGAPFLETPLQISNTVNYVQIIVEGSSDLQHWDMLITPSPNAVPPPNKQWYRILTETNRAFFQLKATSPE